MPAMDDYGDILTCDYRGIQNHTPMSMDKRAAQFLPFSALTGFGEVIEEAAVRTEEAREMSMDGKEEINRRLNCLRRHEKERPDVTVTFFRQDALRPGGHTETVQGTLVRVDGIEQTITLKAFGALAMDRIIHLESPVFSEAEGFDGSV